MRIWIDEMTGCWNWTAAKTADGYGRVGLCNEVELAHRASYRLFVGPLRKGMHIDHLCRNPACCNPAHLELVTPKENVAVRGTGPSSINLRKTHCIRGHEFDAANTYITPKGDRQCRKCRNEAEKIGRVRRRERHATPGFAT